MTMWNYCPRCGIVYDEFEIRCSGCKLSVEDIKYVEDRIVSNDMVDFMTTGTDPRLTPRSDSGQGEHMNKRDCTASFPKTVKDRFESDSKFRKEFLLELLSQIEEGNSIAAVNMIKYITEGVNK